MACYPRTNSVTPADLILTTPRQRLANEHGMSYDNVNHIVMLAKLIANFGERECNGDPHAANPKPGDKNMNAVLWGAHRDLAHEQLIFYVAKFNLTVALNGLRPSLRDANGRYIEIPQ